MTATLTAHRVAGLADSAGLPPAYKPFMTFAGIALNFSYWRALGIIVKFAKNISSVFSSNQKDKKMLGIYHERK